MNLYKVSTGTLVVGGLITATAFGLVIYILATRVF